MTLWRVEILFDYQWFPLTSTFANQDDAESMIDSWTQTYHCLNRPFRTVEYTPTPQP